MGNKIIHIIDDEPVIRESISEWLSKKYDVFSYSSGEEYLAALKQFNLKDQQYTCILLDFQMPGMNGLELQDALMRLSSKFSIIFMSDNANQSDMIDAWHGGAIDCLLKPYNPAKINEILEKHFIRMEESAYKHSLHDRVLSEVPIQITRREAQVLLLLGEGHSQIGVAQKLGISLNTVKMYRSFLKNKLDINTLSELIRYCDKYKKSIEKIANK
jgi:FixJ family two-component response regulator